MLLILAVVAAALALAAAGYSGLGWRQHFLPMAFRAAAWLALGLLLVNPGCPAGDGARRPLVLLDASLSMGAAGGRWPEALDSARRWGEVHPFGDPERRLDTAADAGSSRLAEALGAARATGRPVVIVTDGEVETAPLSRASGFQPAIRLFPRAPGSAASIARVEAPSRLAVRETLLVRASVRVAGLGARTVPLALRLADRELARANAEVAGDGEYQVTLRVPPGRVPPGTQLLQVAFLESVDPEHRDDARWLLLDVTPVPGIVLLAARGDWDARFLLRALRGVTDLPLDGYARLDRTGWRRMADLAAVPDDVVREAAARADLVVTRGDLPAGFGRRGRAQLVWPVSNGENQASGDWYLAEGSSGPVPLALAGFPIDSFPPALGLAALPPGAEPEWVGLTAQLGRRGTPRPALAGYAGPDGRKGVILADGLWRWAFRGGSSEQAYRAIVAATVDWLLAPSSGGATIAPRPLRAVVPNGRPVVFRRAAGDTTRLLPLQWRGEGGAQGADTLRFGPDGQAVLRVAPGNYSYALATGAEGRFVVETWSPEWFPAPITLQPQDGAAVASETRRGLRDLWWLYALGVLALCGEWVVRRRWGLK